MFWMYEKSQKSKKRKIRKNDSGLGWKEKKTSKITNKQQLREVGALKEKYFAKSE